jgi:large subunit ribosomal protein L30
MSTKGTKDAKDTKSTKKLTITLRKSGIGFDRKQKQVIQGLGLRRLHHTVVLPDTPATRGMILKVRHLVEVSE